MGTLYSRSSLYFYLIFNLFNMKKLIFNPIFINLILLLTSVISMIFCMHTDQVSDAIIFGLTSLGLTLLLTAQANNL